MAAAPILPALPDEDIALNYSKKVLAEGNGFTLSITANVNTGTVTWSSSDNKIATVDCGTVTQCGYGWTVIQVCAKFDDQTYSASFSFFAMVIPLITGSLNYEDLEEVWNLVLFPQP